MIAEMESIDRTSPTLYYNKEIIAWLVLIAAALEGSKLVFTPAAIAAMGISLQSNISQGLEFYGGGTLPGSFQTSSYTIDVILLNGNIESRQGDSVSPSCPCHGVLALGIE
ncbi:hypothetical protein OPV22_030205 [Ensete ventricosum]|uniref:Uncharacterized protein n=1 Tax=Ensete ventricosum TaxID=4639 RepID=A0AAV8QBD5_ENSVE|nr:hypothetical protein OPV22_030205 [Ensete ventricosum]